MRETDWFITGYAKLPQGIAASGIHDSVVVALVVESRTGIIREADCTLATETGKRFVKGLLERRSLKEVEGIEESFRMSYHGAAQKALVTAVKICSEKFKTLEEHID